MVVLTAQQRRIGLGLACNCCTLVRLCLVPPLADLQSLNEHLARAVSLAHLLSFVLKLTNAFG